jgi:type II secretion system protein F
MPEFNYQALDRSGAATTGTIVARDSSEAVIKVRALGVTPFKVEEGKKGAAAAVEAAAASRGKKVGRVQILLFTREMSDLLDAGLPIDRAFSVLIQQIDHPGMREMMTTMQGEIRAGQPLSDALRKFPREFPPLYANMIKAGEVSGQLAQVMTRLAEFMEKEQVRRSQIIAALTYPGVLMTVAILAVTFLLTFVIPKLTPVFKDMGAELPLPTQILLGASGVIGHYWWAILLGIIGIVFGFKRWLASPDGRMKFDLFMLNAPTLGPLTAKIVSGRLARTLGTLLGGGVPILEAMDITATAVGNVATTESILAIRGAVRQGETIHSAMEKHGTFLPVLRHMTAVGEETGRLPSMLLRTADTLDFEVDNAMRRLTSLIEPLVVLFMGGFVGFVVLSILLPIFSANNLVK